MLFAILASQTSLCVHLLLESPQHDSQKCPICQQIFSLTHNITVEKPTIISQDLSFLQYLIFHIDIIPAASIFNIQNPRGPPAVS